MGLNTPLSSYNVLSSQAPQPEFWGKLKVMFAESVHDLHLELEWSWWFPSRHRWWSSICCGSSRLVGSFILSENLSRPSKLFLILTRAKENWTLITMILAAEIETEQLCEKWRLICHRRHLMASQTLILPHLRIACHIQTIPWLDLPSLDTSNNYKSFQLTHCCLLIL